MEQAANAINTAYISPNRKIHKEKRNLTRKQKKNAKKMAKKKMTERNTKTGNKIPRTKYEETTFNKNWGYAYTAARKGGTGTLLGKLKLGYVISKKYDTLI